MKSEQISFVVYYEKAEKNLTGGYIEKLEFYGLYSLRTQAIEALGEGELRTLVQSPGNRGGS